ncbi:hypothetical protein J3A83DRAFT_3006493 [Scleroderma citrinum]
MTELDEKISHNRQEVQRHPQEDDSRAAALYNLAVSLFDRYWEKGRIIDLDEAISLHRSALELRPTGHSNRSDSLHSLARSLGSRYYAQATIPDLEEAISLGRAALELRPSGNPDRAVTLFNLACALSNRFTKLGANADLDEAISLHRSTLELRPAGHSSRSESLHELALCLSDWYDAQATIPDLEEAITLGRAALELRPPGSPNRGNTLFNLACDLRKRFTKLGANADLDEAISLHRSALELRPVGNSNRSDSLHELAFCLSEEYNAQATIPDLEEAIALGRAALELRPLGDPNRGNTLFNLACDLMKMFTKLGENADLDEAISLHRSALELCPVGHPNRSESLGELALCLSNRYYARATIPDLEEAITLRRAAFELHPPGNPNRGNTLFDLACALSNRFTKLGANADLDEAILLHRSALELCPVGHSNRSGMLHWLAHCLSERYDAQATIPDLEEAITFGRAALELRPPGTPNRANTLFMLACALSRRFKNLGANVDLDEAILLHRSALELCPAGSLYLPTWLNKFVSCLSSRFERQQAVGDLAELISLNCTISDFPQLGLPDQATVIEILLSHIRTRSQKHLMTVAQATLTLREPRNPDRPISLAMSVHHLAISVKELVDEGDGIMDANEVVNLARASLNLCPPDHSDHITSLTTLATCLQRRFQQLDDITDLDEVIHLYQRVLDAYPSRSPPCALPLRTLAHCLSVRFAKLANMNDLDDAIQFEQNALALCPPGHPDHTESVNNLANYLQLKIEARGAIVQSAHPTCPATSSRIKTMIGEIVFEALKGFPPRLLHTHSGVLCDRDSQILHFENSQQYGLLLSSVAVLDPLQQTDHIWKTVTSYFQYVTLSHRWGKYEPLLHDIEGQVIYNLDPTSGLSKLQSFCLTSCRHSYLWAWSDTCCIDKDSSAELQEAIGSMFSWYRKSALTMVHLADVTEPGLLCNSGWFRRGWTLQELLAPENLLFFTRDWSLYKDGVLNHKGDSTILSELEQATGIASEHLTQFCPGVDDARSRLQWASGRLTTRPEDIAYSLLGVFGLHMPVLYGESAETALGRLLAEVISKSGDTSILDWVGQSSTFHSCFPATLTPYQTLPPSPSQSSLVDPRSWSYGQYIWNLFVPTSPHPARRMHRALSNLPRTQFINPKLVLPCIVHRIQTITLMRVDTTTATHVHQIRAVGLDPIEIALSERLRNSSRIGVPYVLIRPWDSNLLDAAVETDDASAHQWLAQLEQPFRALLLMALPHNEYRRVASFCSIIARPTDSAGVLKGEVSTLTIV